MTRETSGIMTLFAVVLIMVATGFIVTSSSRFERSAVEVHDVARVFVHEPGHYSFLVGVGTALVTSHVYLSKEASIIADVPDTVALWYGVERVTEFVFGRKSSTKDVALEIHVHAAKELEGGVGTYRRELHSSYEAQTMVIE